MITTNLTGNLGNHMWQYAACRTIAEQLGFEWGIDSKPTHDYHKGMNQMYFMDVEFGKPIDGIIHQYYEPWKTIKHVDEVNITMQDPNIYKIQDNTILMGHNGAFGGLFQSEDYLIDRKEDIKEWFKIKNEFRDKFDNKLKGLGVELDDDTCVINFRGGQYRNLRNVILRKKYWADAINHMKKKNANMKFLLVSDDPGLAKTFMPFDIQAVHVEIGFDFYAVNQAKWLIISNSTFGWWAAWLNPHAKLILAPKYWARHNVSDGYWSVGEAYTRGFTYIDREGNIFDYEACKEEALEYYKNKNLL
jgi:hypothetical protein